MNTVESYYDTNVQLEWERFDRHRMEFALTKRALARFLPPSPACILDCGGGPGRYSLHLAQQGYSVTLLDLARNNLAFARQKAFDLGLKIERFVHGNALDLSSFAAEQFDAVLLLGPLYHLIGEQERSRAVCEAMRVLRPGGVLFAGYITLYAPFRDAIAKGYLQEYASDPEKAAQLLETQSTSAGFTDAWFARSDQVVPWMESFQLRTLSLIAVEGLVAGHEQHINSLDEPSFEFWADLNFQFCTDPHLFGAADHLLYVGRKEVIDEVA